MMQLSSTITRDLREQLENERKSAQKKIDDQFWQSRKLLEQRCKHDETLEGSDGIVFCRGCFADIPEVAT